jgi:hypothetical protein
LRDLTTEGVEPNPGPGWGDITARVFKSIGVTEDGSENAENIQKILGAYRKAIAIEQRTDSNVITEEHVRACFNLPTPKDVETYLATPKNIVERHQLNPHYLRFICEAVASFLPSTGMVDDFDFNWIAFRLFASIFQS